MRDYQRGVRPTQIGKKTQRKNSAGKSSMTTIMLIQPKASRLISRCAFVVVAMCGRFQMKKSHDLYLVTIIVRGRLAKPQRSRGVALFSSNQGRSL